jgi:hypothetical protein
MSRNIEKISLLALSLLTPHETTGAKTMKITLDKFNDIDVRPLAVELAAALGGSVVNRHPDGETFSHCADIALRDSMIIVSRKWPAKNRLTLSIDILESSHLSYDDTGRIKFPQITIDPARETATIVKDIQRRLIAPAQEPLQKKREAVAAYLAKKDAISALLEQMRKDFPRAHFPEHGKRDQSFQIYSSAATGGHFSATVTQYGDGPSIHFERIGSVSWDQAQRILAILCEPATIEESEQ